MLIYGWDYIRPNLLLREGKLFEDSKIKELKLQIKEKLMEQFNIKNMETYAAVAQSFERFFD